MRFGGNIIVGKLYRIIATMLCSTLVLTGCSVTPQLHLTDEEEQKIVGYTADLLLKYNKNSSKDLVDTADARELAAKVEALKARRQAEDKESENKNESGNGTANGASDNGEAGTQNIAEALGIPGFEVSYTGYEVCQTYPNDGTTDEFFNMAATMGKELLVFHFDVRNISDAEVSCNILENDPILRILVNGTDRKNVLTTLLLDNLATINETVPAGETISGVAILEVPEGYEADISSLSFIIKRGEEQSIIPLQ